MLHLASLKNQVSFRKNQFFLCKKIKIWTLWEFLLFRSHSPTNMLWLAKFKKLKIFFQKTLFFEITPKFERFEKSYYFSPIIRPTCYFYLFLKFSFFSKNPSPFWEKKWTFWENLNFQSRSTTIFLSLAIFKNWCFFSGKTHLVFL